MDTLVAGVLFIPLYGPNHTERQCSCLAIGLKPIFKHHSKYYSVRMEQCESMISILSVNTDAGAEARYEHSFRKL